MKVQRVPLAYQRTEPPIEKKPSKNVAWSTKAKVFAVAIIGLSAVAVIYAMTTRQQVPVFARPVVKCVPGDTKCEAAKTFFASLQSNLKTTLNSADDDIRRTVHESCSTLFATYNTGDSDTKHFRQKTFFNKNPVWSFLLIQDGESLRKQLEKMCESFSPSLCEKPSPAIIDNMFAYLLDLRWNDPNVPIEGSDYDLFSFCNAQIGKENLYEAADSVAKAKIGSIDIYDQKLALMLFRSLFNEGRGYEAAKEAIKAYRASLDSQVRESVLVLSQMLTG